MPRRKTPAAQRADRIDRRRVVGARPVGEQAVVGRAGRRVGNAVAGGDDDQRDKQRGSH